MVIETENLVDLLFNILFCLKNTKMVTETNILVDLLFNILGENTKMVIETNY